MTRPILPAAIAAALLLTPAPGAAAMTFEGSSAAARAPSAFAGLNLRLPLDRRAGTPTARLQLAVRPPVDGRRALRHHGGGAIELDMDRGLTPRLFVNGREAREVRRELGIGGTTTTLLVVGGAIVLGLAALVLLADEPNSEPCIPGNC